MLKKEITKLTTKDKIILESFSNSKQQVNNESSNKEKRA
jgi:hypothetical protein